MIATIIEDITFVVQNVSVNGVGLIMDSALNTEKGKLSMNTKTRYPKIWRESVFYRFPAMSLRDTLIFIGVCIAGGWVYSKWVEIAFGTVAIFMILHYVGYTSAERHYSAIDKANKEVGKERIHQILDGEGKV
jgi:hypothetical protein